tara:strand:+ start:151 stop:285 length:135 start_codon:yes stop_codon:yes gene_type:complete
MTDDQKKQLEQQFMYILECSDGSYYTGMTKNLVVVQKQQKENSC